MQFDAAALAADDRDASGRRTKIHLVCLDVPGHDARVRVRVFRGDGDALVHLATALPEDGRILDGMTVLDPGRYDAGDIYDAGLAAGRYS